MKTKINCQQVEKLILSAEGNLDSIRLPAQERIALDAHLKCCSQCQLLAEEEHKLTELLTCERKQSLTQPARISANRKSNWGTSLLALSAAIMLMTTGALAMNWWNQSRSVDDPNIGSASLGSMISRPAFTDVSFAPHSRSLASSNHIELPAGSAATLELNRAGTIQAMGPAVFEVDRIDATWKLTWLSGQLKVVVDSGAAIQLACESGVSELTAGVHLINFGTQEFVQTAEPTLSAQDQDNDQEDLAEKLERGLSVFSADANASQDEQREAAKVLYEVFNDPEATHTQKMSAGLYGAAALSNTEQFEKVVEVGEKWQQIFEGPMDETVSAMLVKAHFSLGHAAEAREKAIAFMESFPESPYLPTIRGFAGQDGPGPGLAGLSTSGRHAPDQKPPYLSEEKSDEFLAEQKDGYLVVQVGLSKTDAEHQRFAAVASRAQKFHQADIIDFDGKDFGKLKGEIAKHKPSNVLFVIPPQLLDVNFHRQIFKFAPTLDNDLFVDFAWGYLTARDGATLEQFWKRIENLHQNGMANKNWLETGVIGGESKSRAVAGGIHRWSVDAGFRGDQLYFGCVEKDPNVIEFINNKKSNFENASVIAMTGNGDPQGIWLFDGMRNMDNSLHWKFDPSKVGHDPNNEMLRLKSDWFRELEMQSPIVWSGTCHSGACYRVFVEGDIVSTFGKSDTAAVYDLPADESLCLSLIDGGVGALLVPIAANHGLAVTMESHFAVKYGATLGETVKSTYNDVILQAGGVPTLLLTKKGDAPNFHGEPVMQSGGANRILIGDPALRLFEATSIAIEDETVRLDSEKHSLVVELNWKKGYHGTAWNLFADGRGGSQRMKTRIECTKMLLLVEAAKKGKLNVSVRLTDASGKEVQALADAEFETIGGRSFLHLQASANDDSFAHSSHDAIFELNWE